MKRNNLDTVVQRILNVLVVLIVLAVGGFLCWLVYVGHQKQEECEARGGVLLREYRGLICAQVVEQDQ